MKKEIEKKILSSIDSLIEVVNSGVEFSKEQMPLVINEIINYGYFSHGVGVIASVVVFAVGLSLMPKGVKHAQNDTYMDDGFLYFVPGLILMVIGGMASTCNILRLGKVLLAPRLYIVDQLRSML